MATMPFRTAPRRIEELRAQATVDSLNPLAGLLPRQSSFFTASALQQTHEEGVIGRKVFIKGANGAAASNAGGAAAAHSNASRARWPPRTLTLKSSGAALHGSGAAAVQMVRPVSHTIKNQFRQHHDLRHHAVGERAAVDDQGQGVGGRQPGSRWKKLASRTATPSNASRASNPTPLRQAVSERAEHAAAAGIFSRAEAVHEAIDTRSKKRKSEAIDNGESCAQDGGCDDAAPQKKAKPDHALENFKLLTVEDRVRSFWKFVVEAVKGEDSEDELCRQFSLGGICPFIADVSAVIEEVLIPYCNQLGEQIWRVIVVVWLGGGGPAFRSYRHVTADGELCGLRCPPSARLPELQSDEDASCMFDHLRDVALRKGQKEVLSGDGTSVKFRFGGAQGVDMLRSWRKAVRELLAKAGGTSQGLAAMGPKKIFEHFRKYPRMGELTIKEIFCYLYPAHPVAFDVDIFIPVGEGAIRGGQAVLGCQRSTNWHEQFRRMAENIPVELATSLAEAIRKRAQMCRFRDDARVPGATQQFESGRATAGDVEVCMCFFMNYLRAKHRGSPPPGWNMLKIGGWKIGGIC